MTIKGEFSFCRAKQLSQYNCQLYDMRWKQTTRTVDTYTNFTLQDQKSIYHNERLLKCLFILINSRSSEWNPVSYSRSRKIPRASLSAVLVDPGWTLLLGGFSSAATTTITRRNHDLWRFAVLRWGNAKGGDAKRVIDTKVVQVRIFCDASLHYKKLIINTRRSAMVCTRKPSSNIAISPVQVHQYYKPILSLILSSSSLSFCSVWRDFCALLFCLIIHNSFG